MAIEKQVDEEHRKNCLFVKADPSPLNTFTFIVTVCRWQDHIAALFPASLALCSAISLLHSGGNGQSGRFFGLKPPFPRS